MSVSYEHLLNLERDDFTHPDLMSREFLSRLDMVLEAARVETIITSSYREGDPKSHGKGLAVDFYCEDSRTRFRLLKALFLQGFLRVGIYPTHVHVDVDDSLDQEVCWYAAKKDVEKEEPEGVS